MAKPAPSFSNQLNPRSKQMNMKRFMNKKVVAIGLAAGITLGAGGAAFAYFTSSGGGAGSVQTGSSVNGITITDNSSSLADLLPGVAAQDLTVTATNTAAQAQYVSGISAYLTLSGVTAVDGYTCSTADYLLDGTAGTSVTNTVPIAWTGQELAATNGTADSAGTDTIQFNDSATQNQDSCEGVTVTINYTSN
jgi:hypothetical protein